jgi:hypothetical protein
MKKLGMFTGKLYDYNVNIENIEECLCIVPNNITREEIEKIQNECKQCKFHHEHMK